MRAWPYTPKNHADGPPLSSGHADPRNPTTPRDSHDALGERRRLRPTGDGQSSSSHGHRSARHQPSSRQRGLRVQRWPVHPSRRRAPLVDLDRIPGRRTNALAGKVTSGASHARLDPGRLLKSPSLVEQNEISHAPPAAPGDINVSGMADIDWVEVVPGEVFCAEVDGVKYAVRRGRAGRFVWTTTAANLPAMTTGEWLSADGARRVCESFIRQGRSQQSTQ